MDSEEDAQRVTEQVSTFLKIFHAAEASVSTPGNDADVKQFFASLKVEQQGERAILTATLPPAFLRKALSEPPETNSPSETAEPAKDEGKNRNNRRK